MPSGAAGPVIHQLLVPTGPGLQLPSPLLSFLPRPLPCCSTKQKGQLGASLKTGFMLTQCLQTRWSEALLPPGQGLQAKAETSLLKLRPWLSG